MAAHYQQFHDQIEGDISFETLEVNLNNTVRRKVTEAYYINLYKPSINNREECEQLKGFLVQQVQ